MKTDSTNCNVLDKEIDLIQSCISRMSHNSFMIKGWLITLVAVVLALLPERFDLSGLCFVGFVITTCFWYLDAFFLKTETLYRWKYEWVIKNRLTSQEYFYDLNPYNSKMWLLTNESIKKKEPTIIKLMCSKTLFPMYGIIIICILIFYLNSLKC